MICCATGPSAEAKRKRTQSNFDPLAASLQIDISTEGDDKFTLQNANIRFQSFFMLITFQPSFVASSFSA
jgi:hypothetical protein